MSRINTRDFVGTRARFQRLRDARLFNGWIENFFGNKVEVTTSTEFPVEIGDEFRFEGFGHHISVVFNAKLEAVHQVDLGDLSALQAIEGSNARILEARTSTLSLVVTNQARYAASSETVRVKVQDLYTKVNWQMFAEDGFVTDVSPMGVGLLLREKISVGEPVDVQIQTNLGLVKATGSVRHCRPERDRPGYNRLGVMFTDLGRLERPKWERFLKEIH